MEVLMLSKSQAKAFFILGTGLCAGAFLMLTLDTLKQIPIQTKSANLNSQAIRGKHLFESNNCMGCHTILGEGAYYAPELTKVYDRRGEAFIKQMLRWFYFIPKIFKINFGFRNILPFDGF
jgi:nitric oxide reductase subunit C